MRWNIEKTFCGICLCFLLLNVFGLAKTFILGDPLTGVALQQPSSSDGGAVGGLVRLDWYEPVPVEVARNPFQSVSEWKPAPVDVLGAPPVAPLPRRIPLPALLSGNSATRLHAELAPPVQVDEDEESR